jgi:hypothetical protein
MRTMLKLCSKCDAHSRYILMKPSFSVCKSSLRESNGEMTVLLLRGTTSKDVNKVKWNYGLLTLTLFRRSSSAVPPAHKQVVAFFLSCPKLTSSPYQAASNVLNENPAAGAWSINFVLWVLARHSFMSRLDRFTGYSDNLWVI